jgi:hypothetical protein
MLFVRADGDEIDVEFRGKAGETAGRVARDDAVAATLRTDSLFQLAKPGFRMCALVVDTALSEKGAEAMHEHDVGVGSEPFCRPRRGLDAWRGEVDADQDTREAHDVSPMRASSE